MLNLQRRYAPAREVPGGHAVQHDVQEWMLNQIQHDGYVPVRDVRRV